MRSLFFLCFISLATICQAQLSNEVLFKNNHFTPDANLEEYIRSSTLNRNELISNKHYKFIQFNEIPSSSQIAQMENDGIKLLSYIPNKAYFASLDASLNPDRLRTYNLRHISALPTKNKLSTRLTSDDIPAWAKSGPDKIEVSIMYPKNLDQATVLHHCMLDGIKPIEYNGIDNFILAEVILADLNRIVELPYIQNIELRPSPSIPDDTPGRSLLRANMIDTQTPLGRNYTGEGVAVLCRDDGEVFNHVDFHGRLYQDNVGPDRGSHGDGVSGIMCGAGNKDPRNRGMASGADLYVVDYVASFLDETMDLFRNHDVIVTNSSYSNNCNAGYTNSTRTVDGQCHDNPTLLHVFSAGNSNNMDCDYGAGDQWGNITGGHKQGKNVIATANTDNVGLIQSSSSRGPAHDGRIKPDLSSNGASHLTTSDNHLYRGFGGTSGAAPGIAGVTAMLHQAYRELNGITATSALLKSIMLNTATDLGNKGPDFTYGWGAVNAFRSALVIEENRFLAGTISNNVTQEHSISVPSNAKELRVMVYWSDPAAAVGTEKALINDIDSYVVSPDGTTHMPWVLNSEPIPEQLELPATRGEDHLNNMEQVLLENPVEGTYTLNLNGTVIPLGDHEYYITWEVVLDEINMVYPIGEEKLIASEQEILFWEAIPNGEGYTIFISTDDGTTWEELSAVNPNNSTAEIILPATITDQARIKVTRGAQETISDKFTIAPVPENLEIEQVRALDLTFKWNAIAEATSYDVYILGKKYMEYDTTITSTSITLPIDNPYKEQWFAVSANFPNDIKSRRSIAINSDGSGLYNFVQDFDLRLASISNPADPNFINCRGTIEDNLAVRIANSGNFAMENINICYKLNNNPDVCELYSDSIAALDTLVYTFTTPYVISSNGEYEIETWLTHPDELLVFDDSTFISGPVYLDNGLSIPFREGFSSRNFPEFWYLDSPEDTRSWSIITTDQKNGEEGSVLTLPFENYGSNAGENGEMDLLYMIPLDFSNSTGNVVMDFELAYFYANQEDGLIIEVSTDCGESFPDRIYEKFGEQLSTSFTPFSRPNDPGNWSREEIDISKYNGLEKVVFRFVSINDSGSNLYIDNINIAEKTISEPVTSFTLSTTDPCRLKPVLISEDSQGGLLSYDWDFGDFALPGDSDRAGPHEIQYFTSGEKTLSLTVSNPEGSATHEETINVIELPAGGFTFEELGGSMVQFTSNFTSAEFYLWSFGDGNMGFQPNPIHTFPGPGEYEVTLNVSNKCGQRVLGDILVISTSSTNEISAELTTTIAPNPSTGIFSVYIESDSYSELNLELVDLKGHSLHKENIGLNEGFFSKDFDRQDLAPGIYFIKLSNDQGTKTMKLLITD